MKTVLQESQIFEPGTPFVVSDDTEDKVVPAGSTGFISHVKGSDRTHHNVVFLSVVLTRIGKSGKDRVTVKDISTPIYELKGKAVKSCMPSEQRRQYVHIDKVAPEFPVLNRMAPLDFMAWACAKMELTKKIKDANRFSLSWERAKGPIRDHLTHVTNLYDDNPKETTNFFTLHFDSILNALRILEAGTAIAYKRYIDRTLAIQINALGFLLNYWEKRWPCTKTNLVALKKELERTKMASRG
jgi:hypothetical protein